MENFISNYTNTPNPITKFINKIGGFKLDGGDYSENIELLEAMKKVPLYIKSIIIPSNNAEELENLTDHNMYNTTIDNLLLELCNSFKISTKAIENLQSIYPNFITLDCMPYFEAEAKYEVLFGNFTKLLSKLDNTSLGMIFGNNDYKIELKFSDVILKVVESSEECSYIRAKSVEICCVCEEFCWIKSRDLNMSVLDSYYFCLNKPRYINISEFISIKDPEEIKKVEKMFSNESLSEINKGIIIPMKYSHKIIFTIKDCSSDLFYYPEVEEYQKTIEVMPHIKDIQYKWKIISNFYVASKYLPLFPARTKYFLAMGYLDLNSNTNVDEELRMLNWNDKRIYSIESCKIQQLNIKKI